MTPAQLNLVTASVIADLEEAAFELLAKKYRRLIRRSGRYMAKQVRARAVSLTADIHAPDEDEVIPDNLSDQVDRLTAAERAEMVKLLVAAYEAHEIAFDVKPSITPELLEKVGSHAAFATEADLRAVYRDVIERASLEGYSVPRTANAIVEAVDGVADYRATALARTDLIGLANGASQGIATEAFAGREDVTKVWVSADDDRVRETHEEANGQEVDLNDYFDVGGYPALYPGDPDLPDEEVINCRCTLVYSGGSGPEPDVEAEVASIVASGGLIGHPVLSGSYPSGMDSEANTTAAVTITVNDEAATPAAERVREAWEGILAIEGSPTSDGRFLIPGEIGQRELPLPIAPSHEKQAETETVGNIEFIERIPVAEFAKDGWELPEGTRAEGTVIWGEGSFDGSPESEKAILALENGVGISLDLPMERQALINSETFEEVDPSDLPEEDLMGMVFGMTPAGYLRGIAGKIGGASLASIAAFEETRIRLVGERALVASGFAVKRGRIRDSVLTDVAITAAVEPPLEPPREWFFMDEPDEPTPITITADGRVYGHLALWNTCHAGRANGAYSSCMFAPHSPSGYAQFHLGAILCNDGSEVAIGRLTIGTGHAPLHLNAAAARAHYDHSGTCVAFVRAKDGVFGIWIAGAIKSDATAEAVRDLRACPPSGDWRAVDGRLELQAALAVNAPGYPVPRSQLSLAASADSLEISALILGAPDDEDRAEALRADHVLLSEHDVEMLVELGTVGDPFVTKVARSIAASK